jgi:hypothetical protein
VGEIYKKYKNIGADQSCLGVPISQPVVDQYNVNIVTGTVSAGQQRDVNFQGYTLFRTTQIFQTGLMTAFEVYPYSNALSYLRAPPVSFKCLDIQSVDDRRSLVPPFPTYGQLHNDCVSRSYETGFPGGVIPGQPAGVGIELCKITCIHANGSQHLEAGVFDGWSPCGFSILIGG